MFTALTTYRDATAMVCGGSEASITPLAIAGFQQAQALSVSYNDNPTKSSRPFDRDREGFVMSEGAAMLLLEDYNSAKTRNAKIYGEIISYGLSSDAHHITQPSINGSGARKCMEMALKQANESPNNIDYINAHGTSTPLGDRCEYQAINDIFSNKSNVSISSTKGATGHLLGASGAIEALITLKAIETDFVPPTINLNNPDPDFVLDLTPLEGKKKVIKKAITNSFGFGGVNVSLLFSEYSK
eukprot:TRINITY_DN662_c1_g5_i3.p2 TRINITY_DN662_c1_g5~~TRINITY_DN662_c1_g5_i3.p2  ORF type:complete len:243 (+),score=44.06 TRINITY_DN662_c1_g5_i3:899-1627(+)